MLCLPQYLGPGLTYIIRSSNVCYNSPANAFDSTDGSMASSSFAVSACSDLIRSTSVWIVSKSPNDSPLFWQ
jgi:hypothetical protein